MTKPSDLFLDIQDLFGILLPGGMLAFLVSTFFPAEIREVVPPIPAGAQSWIAFFVGSYVLGHFLLAVGYLLEFQFESHVRKGFRWFGTLEHTRARAQELLAEELGEPNVGHVGLVRFARNRMRVQHPAIARAQARFEAQAFLFRSLTVAFGLVALLCLFDLELRRSVAFFGLAVLSLYLFLDLRAQTVMGLCQYVIMCASSKLPPETPAAS
jgi:hypothetical protein